MLDWKKIEDDLYEITKENIISISKEYSTEIFYAFALSINADYGEIMISLNTKESLKETALDYFKRNPDWYSSEVKAEKDLYWSIGDWKYTDENSEDFQDIWDKYQELISDACIEQDDDVEVDQSIEEKFLSLACRVLHKLNKDGVFRVLNKTEDFKYFVCDHDEDDEYAWDRLKKNSLV